MFIRNKIYIGRLIEISKSKSFNNMFRSCYEKTTHIIILEAIKKFPK